MGNGEKLQSISLALILACCGSAHAADWKFKAGINAGETYTDNVTLAPADAKQSDWITEITPNFSAAKTGARFKADIRYSMQNLFYARSSSRNQIYHQLDATSSTVLWEKEIFFDASASMQQVAKSLLGARSVDNTNATGNTATQSVVTLSPYWIHRFGSTSTLNARYTVANVGYSDSDAAKSLNTTTAVTLASGSTFIKTPWSLRYFNQKIDYSVQPDVEFTTVSGSLGYLINRKLMVTGILGYERNDYQYTGKKPEGRFWNANLSWAVSPRTKIEGGFGNHYYGNTKFFALASRGGHSDWRVDYNESLTTSNSQYERTQNLGLGTTDFGQTFDQYYLTTASLTNTVFLSKRFGTVFNWKKGRNELNLSAYHAIQSIRIGGNNTADIGSTSTTLATKSSDFEISDTIRSLGFNANWRHALTPLMSGTMGIHFARVHFNSTGREDKDSSVALGLERKLSPHMVGRLSVRHQSRQSDQGGEDYSENAISGSVNYSF